MKNLFKKISAILIAAVMVLAMASTAFADDETTVTYPTANDTAEITASNIEHNDNVVVTAYRVVEPKYIPRVGFEKYQTAQGVDIKNPERPTAAEITKIASKIANKEVSLTSKTLAWDSQKSVYKASVGAGYWVVLVTGNVNKVYNPMLAGVYYSVDGGTDGNNTAMTPGKVDASQSWTLNGAGTYEKSVEVTVNKVITNSHAIDVNNKSTDKGDDLAIGDYAEFKVTGKIPGYTNAYKTPKYIIDDVLSDGLQAENTNTHEVTVKVGGSVVEAGTDNKNYKLTVENQKIKVEFTSAFILANAGKDVELTYAAKLTESAATNLDANTNEVTVSYSNDPSNAKSVKTEKAKTYHYTFEIDGNLTGNITTNEITKTGIVSDKETRSLEGAKFTLTRTDNENYAYTIDSDENGHLNFKGLDAGTYTLKEKKAPKGYSLNPTEIAVVITAKYNEDGTLNTYSINIGGTEGKTFSYTNESNQDSISENGTYEIKNTKLSSLPSTGGMGTYLFTIIGVVVMAGAAGAFFISRRKGSEE